MVVVAVGGGVLSLFQKPRSQSADFVSWPVEVEIVLSHPMASTAATWYRLAADGICSLSKTMLYIAIL